MAQPFAGTERYEVRRRLGSGGFGVVYEAYDRQLHRRVALKTLRKLDPEALYRFKREFRALADVVHPNLVALHELVATDELVFIAMELVLGSSWIEFVRARRSEVPTSPAGGAREQIETKETLPGGSDPDGAASASASRSKATARLPPSGCVDWTVVRNSARLRSTMAQLGAGLAAIHRAGKIHRDIKPSNVMVTSDSRLVILDFGLIAEREQHSVDGRLFGSVAYLAPEQAAAGPLTPAADWYAAGVMLFEALTGELPFSGTVLEILTGKQRRDPPPPRLLNPRIPEDLDRLCVRLLARSPSDRPTGDEVARVLGEDAPVAEITTRANVFVGRDAELEQLEGAFASAQKGHATVVYISGERGIGKTGLITQFANQARQADPATAVLAGRCYQREAVPYKALDSLADELSRYLTGLDPAEIEAILPRRRALLGRLFPVLRRVEAITRVSAATEPYHAVPQEQRRHAFNALRELFTRIAERRPLVICLDDLQWGDAESALLLGELLRPPDPPPLLLLCAFHGPATFVERAFADCRDSDEVQLRPMRLEELPGPSVVRLAAALLGGAQRHRRAAVRARCWWKSSRRLRACSLSSLASE